MRTPMRTMILAAALAMGVGGAANAQNPIPSTCEVYQGVLAGENAQHPGVVSLNADGTWTVSDWRTVHEMATLDRPHAWSLSCVGKSLLLRRAILRFSTSAPRQTTEVCSADNTRRVFAADPVMRDCRLTLPE